MYLVWDVVFFIRIGWDIDLSGTFPVLQISPFDLHRIYSTAYSCLMVLARDAWGIGLVLQYISKMIFLDIYADAFIYLL